MTESRHEWKNRKVRVVRCKTLVVGTGASGLNAAERLASLGQTDVAIVTEHMNAGTSRNTGSDKQTYYKLTLAGDEPDSVREMARTLFDGNCVDGEHALTEAAMSVQCFMHLVELGVPFPRTSSGEFVGYKTDHDPRERATSVGPYTSKLMTESLERAVRDRGIPVYERLLVVRILVSDNRVRGVICLDFSEDRDLDFPFVVFLCSELIYAVGGPSGMYFNSVYPAGHFGASGVAFEAGVKGKNLTEWQYSFGSIKPPWTLSGSYMQVLPRFISVDENGEEHEFLFEFTDRIPWMLNNIFRKGYQMPFDVRKVAEGSAIIDILVWLEGEKGRKVYLDYRDNPLGRPVDYASLDEEATAYMEKTGICFGTPIERLLHLNRPAYAFFRDRGIDLAKERLEIVMSVQHNNGGLSVDENWQTNIPGMFAVGEVACTHGVYRPGGAALNSGQVGSTKAAAYIAGKKENEIPEMSSEHIDTVLSEVARFADCVRKNKGNVREAMARAQKRMTKYGAFLRNRNGLAEALREARCDFDELSECIGASGIGELKLCFRLRDQLISQITYLSAMLDYTEKGGISRGGALYTDEKGAKPYESLPDRFVYLAGEDPLKNKIQEIAYAGAVCRAEWRDVHALPTEDLTFENVWRRFRERNE